MSQNQLKTIATALTAIEGLHVYHYWRDMRDAPFCVWQEDGHRTFDADNHVAEKGWTGYVDYYTKTEFDENIDLIESALNGIENLTYELNSADYEEETNLIHYSWEWEMF